MLTSCEERFHLRDCVLGKTIRGGSNREGLCPPGLRRWFVDIRPIRQSAGNGQEILSPYDRKTLPGVTESSKIS